METLGILMALAGGLVAAPVYCWILVTFVRPFPLFALSGLRVAIVMVVLACVEVAAVLALGAVPVRSIVGPGFIWLHIALTFPLPAMFCAALLLSGSIRPSWWPAVALAGWVVGAGVVFLQYDVAESLYGPDGIGGPYSSEQTVSL